MTAFEVGGDYVPQLTNADFEALWGAAEDTQTREPVVKPKTFVAPQLSKAVSRLSSKRKAPSQEQQQKENDRRQYLQKQAAKLVAGRPEDAPRSMAVTPLNTRAPVDRLEAIKTLGLYRKSVKMQPVISGYTPNKVSKPIIFPYQPGQELTKLSRDVSREWTQLLIGVSSKSVKGGRLYGSQGRNLIRIVEELRKHAYLEVKDDLSPRQVREQVVQVVCGEDFCFAQECGMSRSTFYEALKHPLAHLFIRSQKVQYIEARTQARRNCATLFSVALYEPLIPADLESMYWSEEVEQGGIFTVPDYKSEIERTKRRPLTTQKQNGRCGKPTAQSQGSSSGAIADKAREEFLGWIDSAALISRSGERKNPVDLDESELMGCIDRLRNLNPKHWEMATQIAIWHDEPGAQAVAAVGYYKALIHLGVEKVRYWVKRLEKWRSKGQLIQTPGKLLMHHLNKEARKLLHFNISDLGTEVGVMAT